MKNDKWKCTKNQQETNYWNILYNKILKSIFFSMVMGNKKEKQKSLKIFRIPIYNTYSKFWPIVKQLFLKVFRKTYFGITFL